MKRAAWLGLGALLSIALMGASYNVFSPGGALSGTWNSQSVALNSGAFITGTLPLGNGGTGLTTAWARSGYAGAASCNNATAAAAWNLPTTGAPTPACLGTSNTTGVLGYVDAATSSANINVLRLPVGWTGAIDLNVEYTGSTSSTNNIRFQASTACVADDGDQIAPSYNSATAATSAGPGTAGQKKTVAFAGIAVTNCAAGETLNLKLERLGGDGADNYTGVMQFLGMEIVIRVTPQS